MANADVAGHSNDPFLLIIRLRAAARSMVQETEDMTDDGGRARILARQVQKGIDHLFRFGHVADYQLHQILLHSREGAAQVMIEASLRGIYRGPSFGFRPDEARIRDESRRRVVLSANRCLSGLERIVSDVSGQDLSQLGRSDMELITGDVDLLINVEWTSRTTWPSGIAEQIRTRSQQVRPEVFRVGPASAPKPTRWPWRRR